MSRFSISQTSLEGLMLVARQRIGDQRGFLSRMFCSEEFQSVGWNMPIAQINHTKTHQLGAVRGMHFQKNPHAEKKLVSCVGGSVWDVAVDIRPGSATFLQWYAQELSANNGIALLIPEGFAHGFQALTTDAELIYLHSAAYHAASEAGIRPTDPRLAITWPLQISQISARDQSHPLIDITFEGVYAP
jgi:dTDP-4-dehydrorhamnose 3,5-epimerase